MKKIALLFMLGAFAVTGATAQSKEAIDKKVRFGFKLDFGSSSLSPKESYMSKDGGKFYFSYGFNADFTLTDNYIIATGLHITSGGGSIKAERGHGLYDNPLYGGIQANSYKVSLQYLEIPVGLKLKTDDINGIKYWGLFGTYLGINMGARMDATVANNPATYSKEKITSSVVPVNMGLDLGLGIEYPFTRKTYGSFGLGYRNGFIDVTKQSKWNDGKTILNGFFLRTAIFF